MHAGCNHMNKCVDLPEKMERCIRTTALKNYEDFKEKSDFSRISYFAPQDCLSQFKECDCNLIMCGYQCEVYTMSVSQSRSAWLLNGGCSMKFMLCKSAIN